ncbi:TetR/AcrR family transcriptional regulator [Furfurilactobacillus siliginis]|uniref:HTH tetR-type domain-containing protein n=1 Tax=Furfurilactobacillus siliginis TaxID=348151 RepID=A0A0R2L717_9LACO|nr:TetR/AcrR family transcriptional regulator [Furfurilactobacillus siliginis]KRN97184.1 hypothetical protein IV55_GL000105 [Furfurilactobacillus siliginis]GEK28645.1 hypothetical protein LSI01_09560 [Furfurilactobacillus siliginis]
MNKQPQVTNHTKQVFIDTFCTLYSQKPIEKISVQTLTTIAGFNRSTFYQHFEDIYQLRNAVEASVLAEVHDGLANQSTPNQELATIVNCLDDERYFSKLQAVLGPHGSEHFLNRLKAEIPFEKLLNFSGKNDLLTPYLKEVYVATAFALFQTWIQQGKNLPATDLSTMVETLFQQGAANYLKA